MQLSLVKQTTHPTAKSQSIRFPAYYFAVQVSRSILASKNSRCSLEGGNLCLLRVARGALGAEWNGGFASSHRGRLSAPSG
jgi:hypothetical protein